MFDSFHRRFLRNSAGRGISGTSLWWTKLMEGGTLEKRLLRSGGSVFFTTGPPTTRACCSFFPLSLATPPSPRQKLSRFSPTREGVLEPTDPVDMVVRVLVVLMSSSPSSGTSSSSR